MPALYDDPALFDAYQKTRALPGRLNELVELPALVSLMPDLRGTIVTDLGCGTGSMCRWLSRHGATEIVGFDPSEKMLAIAREQTDAKLPIQYKVASIEQLPLEPNRFSVVVSGLVLHYVDDFSRVAAHVAKGLKAGGSFIFSVEHPVLTCGARQWHHDTDGQRAHWPIDRYCIEGAREVAWMGLEGVPRYHRTVSGYVNPLIAAGLTIRRVLEPTPDTAAIQAHPRLADQLRRPPFLVVRADKLD